MTADGCETVGEVMLRRPKRLPADATVGDVRALLTDEHVHMVLLVRRRRLAGTVIRADLDDAVQPHEDALALARLDQRTVTPDTSLDEAHARMLAAGQRRRAVVDHHGHLLGLLCLKRTLDGFCRDRDVAAREAARRKAAQS